jgi:hypothetical protein
LLVAENHNLLQFFPAFTNKKSRKFIDFFRQIGLLLYFAFLLVVSFLPFLGRASTRQDRPPISTAAVSGQLKPQHLREWISSSEADRLSVSGAGGSGADTNRAKVQHKTPQIPAKKAKRDLDWSKRGNGRS